MQEALLAAQACSDDTLDDQTTGAKQLTREEMLDPESCKDCHPIHYREWASSMHAYAIDDPVFEAMNRRGQEETNGELGDFCVDCHAPMAVREGAFTSGFAELGEVPKPLRGVTCYFCHNADSVGEHFNNDLNVPDDLVMRGGIREPVRTTAHRAEYSKFHDRQEPESAFMCGSCHDVVTPLGTHIERTLEEWKGQVTATQAIGFQSCQSCHMRGRDGLAAQDPNADVVDRTIHGHLFAAVDVSLTPELPDQEIQRMAVECELAESLRIWMEPLDEGYSGFRVLLETFAGHNQPSGAAQDRRMWVEFIPYDANGNVLDGASGVIGDDEPESADPNPFMLRDKMFGKDGEEVHMFWEAADHEVATLPPTTVAGAPHSIDHVFMVPNPGAVARVVARVRMRPMGFDVLQDLVDSGHLDAKFIAKMPTFTMDGTTVEWIRERDAGKREIKSSPPELPCHDNYLCELEPGSKYCDRLDR